MPRRRSPFHQEAFGATEVLRLADPTGKVGHAEIKIGDTILMMADEFPEMGHKSPTTLGGSPTGMCIYVPNVDEAFKTAIAAGGIEKRPVQDQFYGDRSGTLEDPFGHQWTIATHIEDVAPDEINRRFEAEMKKHQG